MPRHIDEKGKSTPAQSKVAKGMRGKVHKVFKEWKAGKLHSGSKHGPIVKSHRQATAIALAEGRKAAKR